MSNSKSKRLLVRCRSTKENPKVSYFIFRASYFNFRDFITAFFVFFVLFFTATQVFAAEILVDSKNKLIKTGNQFEVSIFLKTNEEYINAIEGRILFPSDLVDVKEIRDGNTIINFWVQRPTVLTNTGSEIIFSGITPGGYLGEDGLIFSVIFQTKNEGGGIIEIRNARVLLNDGNGTDASVKISNLGFLISDQVQAEEIKIAEINDTDPPESFELNVTKYSEIFEGKYFLVFTTQDKGSGINYYEVSEGGDRFVIAESPYLLQNQDLYKEIRVRAVDKRGNERIAILSPPRQLPWYKNYLILAIILLAGILITYILQKYNIWEKLYKKISNKED